MDYKKKKKEKYTHTHTQGMFTFSHPPLMNLICLQTNLKEIFASETLMFVVLDGGIPVSSGVIA